MTEGRLPSLEALGEGWQHWEFTNHPANAQLLEQAIQRGHLSKLKFLSLKAGPALDAALQGFRSMSQELQQRQTPLVSLAIDGSEKDELDEESLKAVLRMRCFAQLEDVRCNALSFDAVSDYLGKEGGRPSLDWLTINRLSTWAMDPDSRKITSLMNALAAEGAGAPNLETLLFDDADESTFAALGVAYAAGGLTKLSALCFSTTDLSETGARSLFDAAGTTLHKGEALKEIEISAYVDEGEEREMEERIRKIEGELKAAQARGVLLNAQLTTCVETFTENDDMNAEEEDGDEDVEEEAAETGQ